MYLGDFAEDADIFFKFTTRAFATGVPTVLAGTPVLSVYKDEGGAATEKTTAETYFDLDVSHDSIVGWNNVRLDLSGDAFFATGADYSIVITTGTVGGVSVVGENIANFSIENRSTGQAAGATLAADIIALKAETALILADTNELQTDDTPGAIAALNDIAAGDVWAVDATTQQTQGTFGQALGDPVADTGTIYKATVTDATGVTIGFDTSAIITNIGANGASLSALPNQTMDITGSLSGSVGSVTAPVTIDAGSVDAIIDETLTAHVTADSVGVAIKDILADTGTDGVAVASGAIDTAQFAAGALTSAVFAAGALGAVDANVDEPNVEFLMVNSTDHVTPETGQTPTMTVSIDGASFVAKNALTTVAEVGTGIYQVDANQADTNGTWITWRFTGASADDVFITFKTV